VTSPEKSEASERLMKTVDGLALSENELRALDWLLRFDTWTVDAFARIIAKARVDEHRRAAQ
jgi:hypothetical protein